MKVNDKKQKIYDIYVENLNILIENGFYNDDQKDIYLCPICLEIKSLEELTLEDYPPKSVGGKANLLTCKKCNNEAGSKIDSHLSMKLDELQGIEKKVRVSIKGKTINATYNKKEGYIKYSPKNNNPHIFEDTMKSVKGGDKIDLKVRDKISSRPSIKLAMLKTAYLYAFEKFGYTLMLDKTYDVIRSSIKNNNIEYCVNNNIFRDKPYDVNNKLHKINGAYIILNKGYECLFVGFSIEKNGRKDFCFVLLPLPNKEEMSLNKFNELVGAGIKFCPKERSDIFLKDMSNIIKMRKFYNLETN